MKLASRKQTKYSLAIKPDDEFSYAEAVKGDYTVRVKGISQTPFIHPSGYFLFKDLPKGEHTIVTEGKKQIKKEIKVDTKSLNPRLLAFSVAETMVWGKVIDKYGTLIPDAEIKIIRRKESAITNRYGKFLLTLKNLKEEKLKIKLKIRKEGFYGKRAVVTVKKGQTAEVKIILRKKK